MRKILLIVMIACLFLASGCSQLEWPDHGVWEDNVYYSSFSGLRFTMPEGWVLRPEAQELQGKKEYCEFFAGTPEGDLFVMVMLENLAATRSVKITEEDYLAAIKKQLSGDDVVFSDTVSQETVCGEAYTVAVAKLTENEDTCVYYLRKKGDYMIVIIAMAVERDNVDLIMENFLDLS